MTCRGLFGLYLIATATMLVQAKEPSSFANRVIDEVTLGLVRGGESNSFAAFSKSRDRWSTHTFSKHLTIKPWTLGEFSDDNKNDLVVAFEYSGGPVAELVAIDCKGRFCSYALKSPLNRNLKPVLNGDGVIFYIADEVVYAFSGKTGTWDTIRVPGLPDVRWVDGVGQVPSIQEHGFDTESEKGIVVRRPNGTARFLADNGLWQFEPSDATVDG